MNAWGAAWGQSWGVSWGADGTSPPPAPPTGPLLSNYAPGAIARDRSVRPGLRARSAVGNDDDAEVLALIAALYASGIF